MLTTLLAFAVTLGILIAVHEYGHYRVAVSCGIKVLKFSIGFGKPIYSWRLKGKPTEFSIGFLPLGGYVRMLDERESPVDAFERHLAFNTQPLKVRAAVVAAGPAANLLLAVLIYALVNWIGMQEPKAILASPVVGSVAELAGLRGQDFVTQAGFEGEELEPVRSFESLRWQLTQGALDGRDLQLVVGTAVSSASGNSDTASIRPRTVLLPLSRINAREADAQLFQKIGILGPWTAPVLGDVMEGSPAQKSGLRAGDLVERVNTLVIVDGQQLRQIIRTSPTTGTPLVQRWDIIRSGQQIRIDVLPELRTDNGVTAARIGAYIGAPPEMVTVRYGFFDGLLQGAKRTWDVSALTLKMMGRMLIGEASLKNLSGPITIADYAGKSVNLGLTSYLLFLALISVSLGVLNLLPLPVLDGGHLMYYLWEGITGRGVSLVWMERLQRGGVAILLSMMAIAMFNDIARILS